MDNLGFKNNYNPDVLNCLANLSNDEVFTQPNLVNEMLDMLPKEIWSNKDIKFLDPCTKTGVFLREICKRLIKGLKEEIPDLQERLNHIFSKQLFGVAITELTALLSRRSLYCSKIANSKYSICTTFKNIKGNIHYEKTEHLWESGSCKICGATQKKYERGNDYETYAYEFIHKNIEEMFDMHFDVIIGNPPYQLNDGGAQASAMPLYNKFVEMAKKLNPRYITMIIPSRWFAGGKGLDKFRKEMLNDRRIKIIHDFINASECFPGVEIKGGVCYFLWDRNHNGLCNIVTHENNSILSDNTRPLLEPNCDIFIRYGGAISILNKINEKNEPKFNERISPRKPFGLDTKFNDFKTNMDNNYYIKIYANKKTGFVSESQILKNTKWINKWKLFTPEAIGAGNIKTDWIKPIIAAPYTVCTETYLVFGPYESQKESENAFSYTQTKFFHFLLGLRKITQHTTNKVYGFIPMQDFSKPWTDEELYKKYNFTEKEIEFIELMVKPMDRNTDNNLNKEV